MSSIGETVLSFSDLSTSTQIGTDGIGLGQTFNILVYLLKVISLAIHSYL